MEIMGDIVSQVHNSNPQDLLMVVNNVINVVMTVAAVVSACVILLGGVFILTAMGDSAKMARGKKCIMGGVIGLIIAVVAFAVVRFVIAIL